MRQKGGKNGKVGNRFISRVAEKKKKTAAAVCLITVMVLMWMRVLAKKSPATAAAAMNYAATMNNTKPKLEISFIELPKVKGRNDTLSRDFFNADGWENFGNGGRTEEASYAAGNINDEEAGVVAKKLSLEAIVMGTPPQAFINDKLLLVGDKLLLKEGAEIFECEVLGIEKETVFIRCGEAEITLKLMKAIEVSE